MSVIVVSVGRPDALRRCLLGLWQQSRAGVEVIVVADAAGSNAVRTLPFADRIKMVPQAEPNISRARNLGIAQSTGDLLAFIDDDAVPVPSWTHAIGNAFAEEECAAITGPVLGRNGISLQWGPLAVNGLAEDIPTDPKAPVRDGFARKLQGTNMAMRRSVLERLGGFDEAFRFYLDDTDLAYRIGQAGMKTAWVGKAIVHHGYEASSRRTPDRIPLSLFDIGASSAVYLQKYAANGDVTAALRKVEASQSSRLLRLAKARKLDAGKMRELLETLKEGIAHGMERASAQPLVRPPTVEFLRLRDENPPQPKVISGRSFQLSSLRAQAAEEVAKGQPVRLFCFGPTPRKHKVRFTDGGWWEQTGGLFGPSERDEPRFQLHSFKARVAAEVRRISATDLHTASGERN
nr:glycosyltransferase [Hasllibacter sp. MH4015]